MLRLLTIVGARPQFVKAAVISRHIQQRTDIREILVHTGQHYDDNLSKIFFETMEIPAPDYHLHIKEKNHGAQTGKMMEAIEKVLLLEKPDCVLVYGDTNTTLAGSIAAAKLQIPVAHVEAGLRSCNKNMPEEINRILTDHVSDFLFTPTESAGHNLKKEGISLDKIFNSGDVMYEAALYYADKAVQTSHCMNDHSLLPKTYILATIHRAENTDNRTRLKSIFEGLSMLAEESRIIIPLHPRTKQALLQEGFLDTLHEQLMLIDPVGYLDMLILEKHANLIVTDSGGVQKEAYFFHVPCITLRTETEWIELVQSGWNRLVDPVNSQTVYREIHKTLQDARDIPYDDSLYGNRNAAKTIIDILVTHVPHRA